MEIKLLTNKNIKQIQKLYDEIKNKTFTLWDEDYPSEDLIRWDIARKGLWGVFQDGSLIAVSYAGERCEDGEEDFSWKEKFNKRGTFARIGVLPEYQSKGVGTKLVGFILDELKKQGFDGVRILVGVQNEKAIKLYLKFGFNNCGEVEKYENKYYLFELRLM